MLETWNLVRKYTQYLVSENILFSTKTLLILLMSVFFCKIVLILKAFIVSFSFFERLKKTITENVSFADYSSIIQLPDCYKSTGNKKIDNDVTNFRLDVIVNFFSPCFVFPVKFIYWSKFHVNSITVSGVMAIFFYKSLTRNLQIGNTSVWVLPNIWRLGQVRDTKFGRNVSNKMLLNAAKYQGNNFYHLLVIKG